MDKTYKLTMTKEEKAEPVHGCVSDEVCAQLGVDPKHWQGYNFLCCSTDKLCEHRRELK